MEWQNSFLEYHYKLHASGKRIDVQLRGAILPGSETTFDRILITTEDITPYQNALRQEEKNRRLAESMFIYSPTSLWVEDFSRIKNRIDQLRLLGIEDFRTF